MSYDIIDDIKKLKKEKDVLLLSHYYEEGNIQDISDFVGDSLALAQKSQAAQNQNILLSGVVFMAEGVKVLNPTRRVIVPDLEAGCSLVSVSPYQEYLQWKKNHPGSVLVTYINSSVEVKSISDVIVTSSNAKKIIESIPNEKKILFGPDANLGRFLMKQTGRPMELWPGSCEVHVLFSARRLFNLLSDHPKAVVLAHPECDEELLRAAHMVGSTSRLLDEVKANPASEFIVATESGILHQMQKARPDAHLIQAPTEDKTCACNNCPYMKLNTLEKIKNALVSLSPEILISPELIEKARVPLQRMMDITNGKQVLWI